MNSEPYDPFTKNTTAKRSAHYRSKIKNDGSIEDAVYDLVAKVFYNHAENVLTALEAIEMKREYYGKQRLHATTPEKKTFYSRTIELLETILNEIYTQEIQIKGTSEVQHNESEKE